MNITFLVGHLAKERHSLLHELALDLGKFGNKVTVITGFPSRRITEETRQYYLNNEIEEISPNVKVIRVGSKKGEGNYLFIRMLKYLKLTYSIYKKAKTIETDVYYIYSTPPFLGLAGARLRKIAPTLYNAQDLFPDSLVKLKNLSETNILIKPLRIMENYIYNNNSKIITISEDMKKTISESVKESNKVDFIYNWVDTDKVYPVKKDNNVLYDKFNLDQNDFYISYGGDIGLFQNWELILDAAEVLKDKNFNIKFIIFGNGSYEEKFKEEIKKRNLTNISVFPLQPIELIPEVYSLGDLELVSLTKGMTEIALPSKIGQIMAAGSPVLTIMDSESKIAKTIKNNKLGAVVENFSKDSLVEIILYYYKNQEILDEYAENVRQYALNNYNRLDQTKKYNNELRKLYNNN